MGLMWKFICAVPRWGEVEANENGSLKDVDRLLRMHKTVVPERDAWYAHSSMDKTSLRWRHTSELYVSNFESYLINL